MIKFIMFNRVLLNMEIEFIMGKISDVLFVLSLFFLLFAVVNVYGYDTQNIKLLLGALAFFTFSTGMITFDKLTKLMRYLGKKFRIFRC